MKENTKIITIAVIVALIVSVVVVIAERSINTQAGVSKTDVLDMLNDCEWKTGILPSEYKTCDEVCNFMNEKCISGFARLGDRLSVRDCNSNLLQAEGSGEYMCLCCF